jgi:hypothetical protein
MGEFTQIMTRYKKIHNNFTKNKKKPLKRKILGLPNDKKGHLVVEKSIK